jgi:plastocyanin
VRLRKRLLFPLVALLGAAVVVLPALAASSEAKIEVAENCNNYPNWQCWTSPGANPKPAFVTIAPGGVVTFADNTKFAANITWKGAAPTCSSTVPVSPLPAASGWEGTCKFEQSGTYQFEDSSMYYPKATVEVSAAGTTPTGTTITGSMPSGPSGSSTTSSGSGSSTQTGGPAGVNTPLGPLLAGSESTALRLVAAQHGQAVHGSVDVSHAGAGGRLVVELLATRASLASAGHPPQVQVGRVVRSPLRAGTTTFTVTLDARARHALRVRGHLALTVKILLTSAHGAPVTAIRSVVVRS